MKKILFFIALGLLILNISPSCKDENIDDSIIKPKAKEALIEFKDFDKESNSIFDLKKEKTVFIMM